MPLSESEAKVLMALLSNDQTPIMSLPRVAGLGGNAIYNAVRWLSEKGLITDHREKAPPRRRIIRLTEKGRRVAQLLDQIERQL